MVRMELGRRRNVVRLRHGRTPPGAVEMMPRVKRQASGANWPLGRNYSHNLPWGYADDLRSALLLGDAM